MTFSRFGNKFTRYSGIAQLMDDMNEGLRTPGAIMLGGGNPAAIPAMERYFDGLWREMLDDGTLNEALCNRALKALAPPDNVFSRCSPRCRPCL